MTSLHKTILRRVPYNARIARSLRAAERLIQTALRAPYSLYDFFGANFTFSTIFTIWSSALRYPVHAVIALIA